MYQIFTLQNGDHFYTIEPEEVKMMQTKGYVHDVIAAYVMGPEETNCKEKVQIKVGYDKEHQNHIYTTNKSETTAPNDTKAYCVATKGQCSATEPIVHYQTMYHGQVWNDFYIIAYHTNDRDGGISKFKEIMCFAWSPNGHCGEPPTLLNGHVNNYQINLETGKVNPGEKATCTCNSGYKLNGSTSGTITCSGNEPGSGHWMPDVSCTAIQYCDKPIVANGWITLYYPTFGEKAEAGTSAKFVCKDGFRVKSGVISGNMTCENSGRWNPSITCNVIPTCNAPIVQNGRVGSYSPVITNGRPRTGTIASISCNFGFRASTVGMTMKCQDNGLWIPVVACEVIATCEAPELQHGELGGYNKDSDGKAEAGTSITFSCNDGFKANVGGTSGTMTCLDSGEWNLYIICERNADIVVVCVLQELKKIPFSRVLDTRLTVNIDVTVYFECETDSNRYPYDGLIWYNNKDIKCTASGSWEYITCAAACDIPLLENGQVTTTSNIGKVFVGTTAKFDCNYGFLLKINNKDSITLTCFDSGGWVFEISCKPICYTKDLTNKHISTSTGQLTEDMGKTINFLCIGERYPKMGDNWLQRKTIKCVGSVTWEPVECRAACEPPVLTNGKLTEPHLNAIGKADIETTVISSCHNGYRLSSGEESLTLTCKEVNSKWSPETACLPICYLRTLQSIQYGLVSGIYDGQTTVDEGQSVNFSCSGLRYPNVGNQWWLSRKLKCIASRKWEHYGSIKCRAACEKPTLKDGQLTTVPVNSIGKINSGMTVIAKCDYRFQLSNDVGKQTLTCQESDSQWSPNVTCLPRCKLNCKNSGMCVEHLLGGIQSCSCPIGFTGTFCETELTMAPHVDELLETKDQTAIFTAVADVSAYVMSQIPVKKRIKLEIPSHELISECKLARKPCGPYRQNAYVHMGSCYTINHDRSNATIMKHGGVTQGMHLVLFNNESEFLASSLVKGIKLIIHNQDEFAFPENQGRFLSPGFHVMIGMRYQQLNKVDKKCASPDVLKTISYFYNSSYTLEGCLKSCHQKTVFERCGCGDPNVALDPTNTKMAYCSFEERECVNSVGSITTDQCTCPEACRTSIYKATYSFARWPAKNYNIPMCKAMSLKQKSWPDKWLKECNEAYRASHVKVDIYYENLIYSVYTEVPIYTFWNFWSQVGSIFAIFFGISYIFFFECLIIIYQLCIVVAKKLIRVWKKMISVSPQPSHVE